MFLSLISPAKTLDLNDASYSFQPTKPLFAKETKELHSLLSKLNKKDIINLMSVSEKIAEQVLSYIKNFSGNFNQTNSKPAILTFKGDVYRPLELSKYSQQDFEYLQKTNLILSGFYGFLRPLDMMQPYRLEMGRKLKNSKGNNLYDFWQKKVSEKINQYAETEKITHILNLASDEYFAVVNSSLIKTPIVQIKFQESRQGTYRTVGIHAKKARGLMLNYMTLNRVKTLSALKKFSEVGYSFDTKRSNAKEFYFIR